MTEINGQIVEQVRSAGCEEEWKKIIEEKMDKGLTENQATNEAVEELEEEIRRIKIMRALQRFRRRVMMEVANFIVAQVRKEVNKENINSNNQQYLFNTEN